jgi:hypothetical protein
LDGSIIKIENERVHIARFEEAYSDMANYMHQSNRSQEKKIPKRFFTKFDEMVRESNACHSMAIKMITIHDNKGSNFSTTIIILLT